MAAIALGGCGNGRTPVPPTGLIPAPNVFRDLTYPAAGVPTTRAFTGNTRVALVSITRSTLRGSRTSVTEIWRVSSGGMARLEISAAVIEVRKVPGLAPARSIERKGRVRSSRIRSFHLPRTFTATRGGSSPTLESVSARPTAAMGIWTTASRSWSVTTWA